VPIPLIAPLKIVAAVATIFALGLIVGVRLDAQNDPSAGARAYMEGVQNMDGRAVWAARSVSAQDEDARNLFYREHSASVVMTDRDREAYRARAEQEEINFFEEMRDEGAHFDHLRYHGGYTNGTSGIYVFETIKHQNDGDIDYVWAVMTDREGKVLEAQ
jgi:hypothetical protein